MKTLARRSLLVLALVASGLAAVVFLRAITWPSAQIAVDSIPPLAVDDGAIERLAAAIRLPTVAPNASETGDAAAFDAFHRHLQASFPKVHAQLTREVVGNHGQLLTWPGKDLEAKPILLLAHMDVVPVEPGTEAAWTHGAFSGDVADGFVWGRGTLDDKGSLLAILEAVEGLLKQGFQPAHTVLFAFGDDEETGGSHGATKMAALLKSRGIRVRYVLDEGLAITVGIVPGLEAPAALIGIAEKGYVSIELSAQSPGGHSSMPPPQTAVGIVAAAVRAVELHPMPAALAGPCAGLFERLGPEMRLSFRLLFANRWLFDRLIVGQLEKSPTTNAVVRTTAAATMIDGGVKDNVLPAQARAVINFRIKPGDSTDQVLKYVTRVVEDPRIRVRLLDPASAQDPSPESSASSAGFRSIERTIRQVMPRVIVAPSLVLGATDARHYQGIADDVYRFAPYVLGPDDTPRIHGTDERIGVEVYRDCVRFYQRLLINESGTESVVSR
jgi:carboxypeptidase PM20D1